MEITQPTVLNTGQISSNNDQAKRSDKLINYFLAGYFLLGLALAPFYSTWLIAVGVSSISLAAYYSAKLLLPASSLHQYVLSAVLGIFMAQYIYQMHGMFEMHFFAFIGSAVLITYQKWQLQIPIMLVVLIHHAAFSYLQNSGFSQVYFSQLNEFDVQTFVIHIMLATTIFFICGLWAFQLRKYSDLQVSQAIQMAELRKEAEVLVEREEKNKALKERNNILESIGDAFFAVDRDGTITYWNAMAETLFNREKVEVLGKSLWQLFPKAAQSAFCSHFECVLANNGPRHFETSYERRDHWYETNLYPSANGVSVYIKDASARKQAEMHLQQLNKELAASNENLEQFAYVASHDLQEPLRMIISFMSMIELKYNSLLDENGKKYIHFAVDGGKRMRQIILDLLSYSRAGHLSEKIEAVNLTDLMDEMQALFRKPLRERQAQITYPNLPVLYTYKAPIRQILQNLVGNALKYQEPGKIPCVTVTSEELPEHWRFSVSDNGIGIEPGDFERIFVIFQRLHGKSAYPGTGLGLAITKKIIENLGGQIKVESEKGKGSTFIFTIAKINASEYESLILAPGRGERGLRMVSDIVA